VSDPDQTFGHTVDADEATMEQMRRYANAARETAASGSNGAHTVDADETTMEEMRRYAEAARANASPSTAAAEVTLPVPDETIDATPSDVLGVTAITDAVVTPGDPHTIGRASTPVTVPVPPDLPGERWQPPPRTVLPVAPDPVAAFRSPGLWKPAAIVLGVIAAVLAAVLVFTATSNDEQPGSTTVPGSPAATSTPQTGSESDAGDD
jgi:hypothetical protein